MKKITLVLAALFALCYTQAQTTLAAGDIAFLGSNTDPGSTTTDNVSFVLLKDIDAATTIIFTDRGWNDTGGFSNFAGDGELTWTSGSARSAGEIVVLDLTIGALNNSGAYSNLGDQLFALQGSIATPVFIAGLHFNVEPGTDDANWDGTADSNKTSALPNALSTGNTAVRLTGAGGIENDNFQFSCTTAGGSPITGTAAAIRTILHNPANWNSNNGPTPAGFNPPVEAGCTVTLAVASDTTPPVITCAATPADITAGIDGMAAVPDLVTGSSATDDVSLPANITITQSPTAGTMVGVGINMVTVTAMDEAGNTANCMIDVTVLEPLSTSLTAGDIAFVGFNLDGTDSFAFIILEDIIAGTNIKFTDCGVANPNTITCSSGDSSFTWYAPSSITAGTIVTLPGSSFPGPLASQGDQILAYQGTATAPTFLAGIHANVEAGTTNDADWDGGITMLDESALPDQLTNGVNALRVHASEAEIDNWQLDCSLIPSGSLTGTKQQIAAVINDLQYWVSDNTTEFSPAVNPACTFMVIVDNTPPTLVSTDPMDDATGVATEPVLTATFSEPVQFASGGEIVIQDLTAGTPFGTIDAASGAITFSGNGFTIDPMPPFVAGNEYEVQIDGTDLQDTAGNPFAGIPSGGWTFTAAPTCVVNIDTQPQSVEECQGEPIAFSVEATGSGTLSYNWQVSGDGGANFTDLGPGLNGNSSFSSAAGSSANGNQYRIIVTSDNGTPSDTDDDCSVTSDVATLTVNPLPTVTFMALADLAVDAGVQAGLSGGSPAEGTETGDSGVYSGPGVTDGGDGTYSFDPAAAGVGTHTLMYTYTDELGCSDAASDDIEVTSTGGGDTTPPTFASSVPTDDATDIVLEPILTATFSEPVQFASGGEIVIQDLTAGTPFGTIDASSMAISFSGNGFTIDPMPPFVAGNEYEVQIDGTDLEDAAGNPFAGIAPMGWTFTIAPPALLCPTTHIQLSTQQQVDDFATIYDVANCPFDGGISIGTGSDITNLNGLAALESVGGDFSILFNSALTNLDGLSSLNTIGGDLLIRNNQSLTDLGGLSALNTVGGALTINGNNALENVNGLSGLTSIGGKLTIQGNDALMDVDGFANLTTINGRLEILDNDALANLNGLGMLTSIVDNLEIDDNDALANGLGLSSLNTIGGDFFIYNNVGLTNLNGLESLTSIGRSLEIDNNDALINIDGLSSVSSIGDELLIEDNTSLANCVIDAVCDETVVISSTNINGNTGACADLPTAEAACAPPALSVLSFNLVDADNNVVIGPLMDGDEIDISTLPTMNLNIQAVATGNTESVELVLDGTQQKTMTENFDPYVLFGDNGGSPVNYFANVFAVGPYTLTATPYSENVLGGTMGTPLTIDFSFVESPVDNDGDGFFSDVDCNDNNPAINPGAEEVCDGIDNNCDGLIDDEDMTVTCDGMSGPADLIDATYLMGASNPSPLGPILRTEEGNRETYLKFDLSGFNGPVTDAELRMTVSSDPGHGTLEVFLGSDSNWTETGLNGGNKPTAVGGPIGSISGTHSLGQTKVWDLDVSGLTGGGEVTLIVKHSNGNDVAFASDETAQAPELIITTGGGGPVDMDGDGFFSDVDCDDNNPAINPGAEEVCDGIDNNCDGLIDDEDPEVDCDVVMGPADLIDATYLQGASNPSPQGPILRAEEGNRVTYLKFDISEFDGPITNAELRMVVASDPGHGTLEVFLGSDSNWTENGLNGGNKPSEVGGPLATITGTHSLGQVKVWDLDAGQLTGGGELTLIVKHSNGNDVAFASDETNQAPELIITTDGPAPEMLNELNLFPNPASGEVTIGFEIPTQVGAIFIYDVSGKLVQAVPPSEIRLSGDYELNVSGLPAGMYFVRTFDERGVPHQKPMVINNN